MICKTCIRIECTTRSTISSFIYYNTLQPEGLYNKHNSVVWMPIPLYDCEECWFRFAFIYTGYDHYVCDIVWFIHRFNLFHIDFVGSLTMRNVLNHRRRSSPSDAANLDKTTHRKKQYPPTIPSKSVPQWIAPAEYHDILPHTRAFQYSV